jgi:hypothetical protein
MADSTLTIYGNQHIGPDEQPVIQAVLARMNRSYPHATLHVSPRTWSGHLDWLLQYGDPNRYVVETVTVLQRRPRQHVEFVNARISERRPVQYEEFTG